MPKSVMITGFFYPPLARINYLKPCLNMILVSKHYSISKPVSSRFIQYYFLSSHMLKKVVINILILLPIRRCSGTSYNIVLYTITSWEHNMRLGCFQWVLYPLTKFSATRSWKMKSYIKNRELCVLMNYSALTRNLPAWL